MSTKIYNAYKFNENYNLYELNKIMDQLREEVTEQCNRDIITRMISKTLRFYNFKQYHGDALVKEMIEKTKTENNKEKTIHKIWKYVLANKWDMVYIELCFDYKDKIFSPHEDINDYKCLLQILPTKDKILAMYFGNKDIQKYIKKRTDLFSDYHYQNICEKPDCLSDKEWEIRKDDWEQALGPDYTPSSHGFTVNLFKACDIDVFRLKERRDIQFPSEEKQIEFLKRSFSSNDSVEAIKTRCKFITNMDEFSKLVFL